MTYKDRDQFSGLLDKNNIDNTQTQTFDNKTEHIIFN